MERYHLETRWKGFEKQTKQLLQKKKTSVQPGDVRCVTEVKCFCDFTLTWSRFQLHVDKVFVIVKQFSCLDLMQDGAGAVDFTAIKRCSLFKGVIKDHFY